MRWRGNRRSSNVEDRRNMRVSGLSGLSGGSGIFRLLPLLVRFLGVKGTVILAAGVIGYGLFTGNLGGLLGGLGVQGGSGSAESAKPLRETAEERELVDFVSVVLADTEETWHTLFREEGKRYQEPKLVLFRDAVKSACGFAQSATGPFYCPADQKVFIDLGFFSQLRDRFKAPGDFAQAYVIAHEIGHHVQTLLGISGKVQQARRKLGEVEGNQLSVRQELQADCLAGVWAHHAHRSRQLLESGDVEEGLTAASAIGDDTLQRQSRGYVSPDSFTHGSSAQRVKWFKIGLAGGDMHACDTFSRFDTQAPERVDLQRATPAATTSPAGPPSSSILDVYENRRSDVQVLGSGTVARILPDDNRDSRHQKFILRLPNGQTLLVAHNIDLAPRIVGLKTGDQVEFYGEYEWNEQGGILHWTHDDPDGSHEGGWLKHEGTTYQ